MKPQLKPKLNLAVILHPRLTGCDVVTGSLPGEDKFEVVVARRWKGWTPLLRITLARHVIHFGEASESDRQQFDELHRRALSAQCGEEELSEERLLRAAEAAKLFVPNFHEPPRSQSKDGPEYQN